MDTRTIQSLSFLTDFLTVLFLFSFCDTAVAVDLDIDEIEDDVEEAIADYFSPVLHKHPNDLQASLANADDVPIYSRLEKSWTAIESLQGPTFPRYETDWNPGSWNWNQSHRAVWNVGEPNTMTCPHGYNEAPFHQWNTNGNWHIDLPGDFNNRGDMHGGAEPERRHLYYHVFKTGDYFVVQYWYFFLSNRKQITHRYCLHQGF
ncbi:MAG: hypothetical protein P9X24_16020 [Candidatus Hatepunaea meridiana]|nr:hypothetical protein [Candidatus Hatepunaea meridiana]